ncbi:hypothetical protein [Nannocystis punicea]|uniref:Uncharacterized protein n=1 Tax=Nannocystis punicea TaxID=2995304 RepID=A0ABY7H3N3_9BACT|nr:hypothetical protein [Nannocystis poenicansa]WAS93700.1 hypothetical protein O0S08_46805 [Nannocystis poenicansa]
MPNKFAGWGLMFALLMACAEGTISDTGSIPLPTTNNPTITTAHPNSSAGDSDSSSSGGGGSEDGTSEPPTSSSPGSSDPLTTTTVPPGVCGDGNVDANEACDGESLVGSTCTTEGFGAGTLLCGPDCQLFTDGCYTCGDGLVHMAEACDGANFNGKSCVGLGYGGGNLVCAPNCKSIDTAGCTPLASCGNGVKEGAEQCDGPQLGGQSCVGLGYDQGLLSCTASCTIDTSGCETLTCAGQGEFCIFDENNPQSNCCPAGVKDNILGICDIFICF